MGIFSTHIHIFFSTGRRLRQMLRVFCPFLTFLSVACLPALLFSSCGKTDGLPEEREEIACNREKGNCVAESKLMITQSAESFRAEKYDVFIYEDDAYARLDSYQSFSSGAGKLKVSSGSGEKVAVVLGNIGDGLPQWEKVLSLKALSAQCSSLENEGEDSPVLRGMAHFVAGENLNITLRPLLSRVRLRSLCCDFRGTAYAFESLENVKVYLTNVNAECPLVEGTEGGVRIVNGGALNLGDLLRFRSPEIVYRELTESIGMDPVETGVSLYCYPNPATEEGFGSPFTRLVIEGTIQGKTWYWPININTIGEGGGIRAGESYDLSVMLRRSGTSDPDTPIGLSEAELKTEIVQWNEKENYRIIY